MVVGDARATRHERDHLLVKDNKMCLVEVQVRVH